jgi:molybdopterin-guanine dinucleotide biosynthesis protein B
MKIKPISPPIIQIVGYRNSGKTTLLCRLVNLLTERGWRVGTVKHDAHQFDIDHPGKDTWKHRLAGAETVAIASEEQTAVIRQRAVSLDELLLEMDGLDLVLVEGYKWAPYPKIVLIRTEEHLPLLMQVSRLIAVVSWIPVSGTTVPVFDKDDDQGVFERVLQHVKEED